MSLLVSTYKYGEIVPHFLICNMVNSFELKKKKKIKTTMKLRVLLLKLK